MFYKVVHRAPETVTHLPCNFDILSIELPVIGLDVFYCSDYHVYVLYFTLLLL